MAAEKCWRAPPLPLGLWILRGWVWGGDWEVQNLTPFNSVCVKPVSEGEAFSSLSSLPPTAAHEATKITRQEV